MPALQSATQEAFAQAIARKVKGVDAYSEGHPKATRKACAEGASRMARIPKIAARIMELRTLADQAASKAEQKAIESTARKLVGTLLTMSDRRRIMAEIANNEKCEEEIRMRAVMNDAKLAGELIDKQDLTSDGEALPSVMPSINLQMPQSFLQRRTGPN